MKESEAIRHLERHYELLLHTWKPYPDYKCLDSIGLAISTLKKQQAAKPKHTLIKYGKHNWKKDKKGNDDIWAWESGYHYGVVCVNCGETVCVGCNPDYNEEESEDCEEEYYECPICGKRVYKDKYCSTCGQKLDWN